MVMKFGLWVCVGVAALLVAERPALCAKHPSEARACVNAYKSGENMARLSHLRSAKELMLSCSKPVCGATLRRVCTLRAVQLEEDIPTIVPVVSGPPEAAAGVRVTMDGEPLTSKVDGTAVSVDPGPHEFAFLRDQTVLATEKVVVMQGQRNHRIVVAAKGGQPASKDGRDPFESSAELPVAQGDQPSQSTTLPSATSPAVDAAINLVDDPPGPITVRKKSSVPYYVGLVGLGGLGGYALLSYWARKDNALLDRCAPACDQASVDHVRNRYLQADIALAGGATALVVSTVWLLFRSGGGARKEVAEVRPPIDVQVSSRGAVAAVSGSF
jgi:hypothetical protein